MTALDNDVDTIASLQLDPEAMRALGYQVIDAIVAQAISLPEQSTAQPTLDRAEMDRRMWKPAPSGPTDALEVLGRVKSQILATGHRNSHPRYFAYVPNPSNFVGAMGDALAAGFNVFSGMWMGSPGAAETELVVCDWLRSWCGLPETGGGVLLSGSSMANMSGLVAARSARFAGDMDAARTGTIYYSDQAHSSVAKGARIIGIGTDRMRKISTDANLRMSIDALREQIAADRAAGLVPFCVIAAAGTTNTAAVDPLPEIADICRSEHMWMHVDGAFAAAAMLTERGKKVLAGIERADSIALDAHKWLFQPIECGVLLVRDVQTLRTTFHDRAEYLRDADTAAAEVNFCDLGPQLTREFRALKLWMSVQTFGLDAFRAALDRTQDLAELIEHCLRESGRWQILTPASLGVVSFKPEGVGPTGDACRSIARLTLEDGYLALSTTEIRGETVLRMCVTNPRATNDDIREAVRRLGLYLDRSGSASSAE